MKKSLLLILLLTLLINTTFAQNPDSTATGNNTKAERYQPAKRETTPTSAGICKDLTGTIITVKGMAPYMTQPEGNNFWPRFSVSGSAGYIFKYFTVEGVLEYMQANTQPVGSNTDYYNYILGSARIGALLPIQLNNTVMLIPNVKGQLGGSFYFGSGFSSQFQAGVIGGLDLGFRFGGNKMVAIGFAYDYRWFVNRNQTIGLGMMGGQLSIVF